MNIEQINLIALIGVLAFTFGMLLGNHGLLKKLVCYFFETKELEV